MATTRSAQFLVCSGRAELALPFVCDLPHGGLRRPKDFRSTLTTEALQRDTDRLVASLWGHAPDVGATLVSAEFLHSYIDPDRPLAALDSGLVSSPWLLPYFRSRSAGAERDLIASETPAGAPIYARKLTVAEVRQRIDTCWAPYRAAVRHCVDRLGSRWGCCWHLNLQSFSRSKANADGGRADTTDFVLGDRRGASCGSTIVDMLRQSLEVHGYTVAVNSPYQGGDLVRSLGQPGANRHSLLVTIRRGLYMDESTGEPTSHFADVRVALSSVLEEIARHLRTHCLSKAT